MVQFTSLRLTGFKSFVDATEVVIDAGLTGIVGPNGCGKSNILEALRWCMGEGSARQLRGGGMDDVIFSGTRDRPARNIAEVMIRLDNAERRAPPAFNEFDVIEVVRRIERDSGSAYKVNGKDVRAADVRLLFADLSTGARSTAIVGQGRIGAIINAKPVDRRMLLEEAAGITGLHSRRHEAELRLKAAEANLARLEDVMTAISGQMQSLKRQARQATRYRNLSEQIRRTEAALLHLRWTAAAAGLDTARQALEAIEAGVREATVEAARLATAAAEAGATLPGLRQKEAESAAALQRLIVQRDGLEADERRIEAQQRELRDRLGQIATDIDRERTMTADADTAIARLNEEEEALRRDAGGEDATRREAAERLAEATGSVEAVEAETTRLTERVATAEAQHAAVARSIRDAESRLATFTERMTGIAAERDGLAADPQDAAMQAAASEIEAARIRLEQAQAAAQQAEVAATAATETEGTAREALRDAQDKANGLRAEVKALTAVLARDQDKGFAPVLDAIEVAPGYETALGVALGDDLSAPIESDAAVYWGAAPDPGSGPALPKSCEALAGKVKAPAQLAARLAQIAVVADEAAALPLVGALAQGQRLVTLSGALWRWDGLVVRAGAPTSAAIRLEQENRLRAARAALAEAEQEETNRNGAHAAARDAAQAGAAAVRTAGATVREAMAGLETARDAHARLSEAAMERRSRIAALADAAERLAQDHADAEAALAGLREAEADLPSLDADRKALEQARTELAEARRVEGERRQVVDRLAAEADGRRRRGQAIAQERKAWQDRKQGSDRQMAQLESRRAGIEADLAGFEGQPEQVKLRRDRLEEAIAEAERVRKALGDRLAETERHAQEVDRAMKEADRVLADMREERGLRQGALSQADAALAAVVARIGERLECQPEETLALAALGEDEALPRLEEVEARLDRLQKERIGMGPVNHRAEQEATELEEQLGSYATERDDLVGAIDRFRKAINELNREGRERLLASFEQVNAHFEGLFTRLFGGGRAHLKLADADDPLEAGLEIMASPPGKRLQHLSLLSGGEQALTAMALLFAVFLTNPAPVCVLDEVDAPLDDANVDRFCTLVADIARTTRTRFLLVTHHRMTMARMDRLYGVTMSERGVSQLVSVDLQEADTLREAG